MTTIKGIKHASPGHYFIVELVSGVKIRCYSMDFPAEVVKNVTEYEIDLSTSYITKGGLVIPNFKTVPINVGNVTKNWFKPIIIKWYYSDDDQIAIILNNVGGDAEDKQAYKDMQALRKASSKFAAALVERTKELLHVLYVKNQAEVQKQIEAEADKNMNDNIEEQTDAEV